MFINTFLQFFNVSTANQKLHRENFFSQDFLIETLENIGFKNIQIQIPVKKTPQGSLINITAKIYDKHGNSLVIKIYHYGNVVNFSASTNNGLNFKTSGRNDEISITKVYQHKYINDTTEEYLFYGNQLHVELLKQCQEKANMFFEDLKDEFKRRHKFFAR